MRDKGIKINIDSDKFKEDLLREVEKHQNGSKDEKACNRSSCHLNMVVNIAALKQSEKLNLEKFT